MRYIATLLGLVPALAFLAPSPVVGSNPDFSGVYANCSTIAILPDIPPASIEIEISFDGGVNDVVIAAGAGSIIPEVSNTFIADGKTRNMLVSEFGLPVGASRMCQFESVADAERMIVDQTDDLFGTIIQREITIELFESGQLWYSVGFGPFIVYSVRCQRQGS